MTKIELKTTHPTENELAAYLDKTLSEQDRIKFEEHVAACDECLTAMVSAYESVKAAGIKNKRERFNIMKKINIYLILAIISFALSFVMPQYFLQFLVATLLLGIKWVADAKSTKMLIMVYEAWKKGGEKEASRILSSLEKDPKSRL